MIIGFGRHEASTAENGIGLVDGLRDVEVEFLPCRHPHVKPVALDRVENLLRIGAEYVLCPCNGHFEGSATVLYQRLSA